MVLLKGEVTQGPLGGVSDSLSGISLQRLPVYIVLVQEEGRVSMVLHVTTQRYTLLTHTVELSHVVMLHYTKKVTEASCILKNQRPFAII